MQQQSLNRLAHVWRFVLFNAVLLASASGGPTRYCKSTDTSSWHKCENAPAQWMTSGFTARAQSRCAKPCICPEPNKPNNTYFFLLVNFFFSTLCRHTDFPKEHLPRPSLYKIQAVLGSVFSPRRCSRGTGLWPRDGRRRTRLGGHILWRDKSFPTAPNETSIIHAVSFFQSTNHVGSFRSGRSPLLQTATPHLSARGTLCHMRV